MSRSEANLAVSTSCKDGVYMTDGEAYRFLGEKWESLGGRWGGRFGLSPDEYASKTGWDSNHFELSE